VQLLADVMLQKSVREGFGLTVAEALWKSTPVVGGTSRRDRPPDPGRHERLPRRQPGRGGGALQLAARPPIRGASDGGRRALWVRDRFLVTRLLADELALYAEVMSATGERARTPSSHRHPTPR
jgi:trehalose synthase